MSSKWKESQTNWVSCHSVAIQQADGRMSQCSQTEIPGHRVKQQRLPTKDLDPISHCDTKKIGLKNGQTRQINQNRQNFIEITERAQKWKENQTDWVSCHSVAIQQADERMSQCSQTEITGHHVKHHRWPTTDFDRKSHCDTKNTGTGKNTNFQIKEKRQSFIEIIKWAQKGRKTRLTGYHATVLRFSRQMGACNTAVKRKLPAIT